MSTIDKIDEISSDDAQSPKELARRNAVHLLTRVAIMTPVVMTMLVSTKANALAIPIGSSPGF